MAFSQIKSTKKPQTKPNQTKQTKENQKLHPPAPRINNQTKHQKIMCLDVLAICCANELPKTLWLKTTHLLIHSFCRSRIWVWLSWSASGSLTRLRLRCQSRLWSYLNVGLGKNSLPNSCDGSVSCWVLARCHFLSRGPLNRAAHNMMICFIEPNKGESLLIRWKLQF